MNQEKIIGPVNIGNPNEISIQELANKIIVLSGKKAKLIYGKLPMDDPSKRKPDISTAKRILNWEPKVELEEGLTKTIDYFKNRS
jgi:UDP-glucuronate decarboxylase